MASIKVRIMRRSNILLYLNNGTKNIASRRSPVDKKLPDEIIFMYVGIMDWRWRFLLVRITSGSTFAVMVNYQAPRTAHSNDIHIANHT